MATPTESNPNVQHNFDGDARILNATFERRTEVRKALTALAQDLQRLQGRPTQVKAEIKLQVGGDTPSEHVYKVSITDQGFDAVEFAGAPSDNASARPLSVGAVSSPQTSRPNGQQATRLQATAKPDTTHVADANDDLVEIRPFKRQKTGPQRSSDIGVQEVSDAPSKVPAPAASEDTMRFLQSWHGEWTRQGGWLFDTLTKTSNAANHIKPSIDKKLDAVQDILGQSMNASSASTIAELASITKLIHWLEHCRKTSADKVQAREEKWRSSSATFHDQSRREREAAEKRIERKLDEQNAMLASLMRANGTEATKLDQPSGASHERSREASLGAQLTAELNMEAGRQGNTEDEPFSIDD